MGSGPSAVMRDWDRAYEMFPRYAGTFAFDFVVDVMKDLPPGRVYEPGFGSGMNLLWARQNGWEVAGCEVAEAAFRQARQVLPGADLRKESIVECTARSAHYDLVIDRAALSCVLRDDLATALAQIHRILKPGGQLFFNPYGAGHNRPFPDGIPPITQFELAEACTLFDPSDWEVVRAHRAAIHFEGDPEGVIEETLRILVRKSS
jgi:SAM-dependent methyltransferase